MHPKDYVKSGINIVKEMLEKEGSQLRTGKTTERPMAKTYSPDLDTSPILGGEMKSRYNQLIGMLRWAVEL
jgi:hypothetical protein